MTIYLTVIAFNFAIRMRKKNLPRFYFVTTLFLVQNGFLELLLQLQLF